MKLNPTYAIVDIETTPTKDNRHKRIIQFSCVMLAGGKIVNQFNTLINPQEKITPEISDLTGINDNSVKTAPLFDDVALTIYNLLQDTTFVAHNIAFDFRYLNEELERSGLPALQIPGIDTVELTKIAYPVLPSYRLQDLSAHFKFTHKKPHHADSDAYVTALLLQKLAKRFQKMPPQLLKTLAAFSGQLSRQTGDFIKLQAAKKASVQPDQKCDYVNVGHLLLRRQQDKTPQLAKPVNDAQYPRNKKQKETLFSSKLKYYPSQAQLMDDTYTFLNKPNQAKVMVVDAPTGLGKTLGYLLPTAYLAHQHKVVIATATTQLQSQVMQQVEQKLYAVVPFELAAINIKSARHYIDIARFAATLMQPQTPTVRLIQLQLIVWLSQTKTGDMAELNYTNLANPFFEEIRHHGIEGLDDASDYYQYDFVVNQAKQLKKAQIIITNHAYLLNNVESLTEDGAILIVDEVQRFFDSAIQVNEQQLDFDQLKIITDTTLVLMQSHINVAFSDLLAANFISKNEYKMLLKLWRTLNQKPYQLRFDALNQLVTPRQPQGIISDVVVPASKIYGWLKQKAVDINQIIAANLKLANLNHTLVNRFEKQKTSRLTQAERDLLTQYFKLVEQLNAAIVPFYNLQLNNWEQLQTRQQLVWFSFNAHQENAHLRMHFGLATTKNYLSTHIYQRFAKTLLVAASATTGVVKNYLTAQLDLPQNTPSKYYQGTFDFLRQAKLFKISDGVSVNNSTTTEYYQFVAAQLNKILTATNEPTLVLFTAQNGLAQVYEQLSQTTNRTLLAQGITGGAAKVKKRFLLSDNAVLLGLGSFWQGMDLPDAKLSLVIICRLPFSPPNTPLNQVRYEQAQKNGKNPFYQISLPEACLQLNQGFGRLIRTPDDFGAAVVLDNRMVQQPYADILSQSLPEKLPQEAIKADELAEKLAQFLSKRPK